MTKSFRKLKIDSAIEASTSLRKWRLHRTTGYILAATIMWAIGNGVATIGACNSSKSTAPLQHLHSWKNYETRNCVIKSLIYFFNIRESVVNPHAATHTHPQHHLSSHLRQLAYTSDTCTSRFTLHAQHAQNCTTRNTIHRAPPPTSISLPHSRRQGEGEVGPYPTSQSAVEEEGEVRARLDPIDFFG